MIDGDADSRDDEPADLEPVGDVEETPRGIPARTGLAGYEAWKSCWLHSSIPSLFLDKSLRILQANDSFCALFGFDASIEGTYFTQFYAASFDTSRSSELFRAVLSPETRFEWCGRVDRIGTDRLLNVSKVWIQPARDAGDAGSARGTAGAGAPGAYCAICLDMTAEHRQRLQGTFSSLLGAARLKDNDTGNHIERVNLYARVLAQALANGAGGHAVDQEFVETIGLVAALHDIGKIGTPDDILNKAGQLEAWEWDVMKQHTINGAYILATYPNPMAREIALHHHERWDGTGYPMGLSGDMIPLSARVVGMVDVYDALRMRRAYKTARTHELAVENMTGERGTHFDPVLVDTFLESAEELRRIFSDLADAP